MTGSVNVPAEKPESSGSSSISSGLLHGLQTRDPEAWRRMAVLYTPLIYGWGLRAGLQQHDAADIVQEVFRAVVSRVIGFTRDRPDATFRGWLWQITHHKLGDHFRQGYSRPQAPGGSDALVQLQQVMAPADSSSKDLQIGLGGLCHRGLTLVRVEFREKTWQAFWRVVIEDQSPEDVARSLDISLNAVYLAKSRILRRLREVLGDNDG